VTLRPRRTLPVDEPAPAPAVVPAAIVELVDHTRDERLERILRLWSGGANEVQVVRAVCREFPVTPDQVRLDFGDVREALRRELDDESNVDMLMVTAAGHAREMQETFVRLALEELPDRVLHVPSNDPENRHGEGAIYRDATPAEKAALINAKAAAGRTALACLDFSTKLLSKRSVRWSDKPSNVIVIGSVGKDGLTEEERTLLQSLGMERKP
jgi:nucleotide-binding universal stress UspA family protein